WITVIGYSGFCARMIPGSAAIATRPNTTNTARLLTTASLQSHDAAAPHPDVRTFASMARARGVSMREFRGAAKGLGGDRIQALNSMSVKSPDHADHTERARPPLLRAMPEWRFLQTLKESLRPLRDPIQVQDVAARLLGEHLHADRVNYARIDGDHFVVTRS